jgi:hypothetical protein
MSLRAEGASVAWRAAKQSVSTKSKDCIVAPLLAMTQILTRFEYNSLNFAASSHSSPTKAEEEEWRSV